MILINNEWHNPLSLSDVSNIIREHFSYDLSHKLDELVGEIDNNKDSEIDDLNNDVWILEDSINDKDNEICELRDEIDRLLERIKELENK